ncbi:alpha/beta hydrolase [Flavobacterium sp.]|uniref:alpha/beta hydrolase n=1 Tax=Flavobacterium sp. TaxID=239 RepID=UPI003753244B
MFEKISQLLLVKTVGCYVNIMSFIAPEKSFALAYKLFSEPRKGRLKKVLLPKTLLDADFKTHIYEDHEFQTYTWTPDKTQQSENKGNDEIILLIHGWESNASRWKKLLKHLKKTKKTIIAIDGPAHGLTSGKEFNVPQYAKYINLIVQEYNPSIAIGHSIGGNALAYYQAHYKHNINKMVLLGAPSDFEIILKNYVRLLSLNSRVHQSLIAFTKKKFNITVSEFSAAKFLENSTINGIVAHDQDDKVVLFEEGKKISNAWKTSQFIETKGLGHSLHDAYLYQTIVDFIEK